MVLVSARMQDLPAAAATAAAERHHHSICRLSSAIGQQQRTNRMHTLPPPLLTTPHPSHAIVSSAVGPEYYVTILSFVDKTQLEPGCSVLLHNKVGSSTSVAGREGGQHGQTPSAPEWAQIHSDKDSLWSGPGRAASLLLSVAPCVASPHHIPCARGLSPCHQVMSVVGILQDETDPMVSVMKVRALRCCTEEGCMVLETWFVLLTLGQAGHIPPIMAHGRTTLMAGFVSLSSTLVTPRPPPPATAGGQGTHRVLRGRGWP
jgi:hypothetical protein